MSIFDLFIDSNMVVIDVDGATRVPNFTFFLDLEGPVRRIAVYDESGDVRNDIDFSQSGDNTRIAVWDAKGALRSEQFAKTYSGPSLYDLLARPGFSQHVMQFVDRNFEVLYLYDTDDRNFGYALNIDIPMFSEWGYMPSAS